MPAPAAESADRPPGPHDRLQHIARALVASDTDEPRQTDHLLAMVTTVTDRRGGEAARSNTVDLLVRPLDGHPVDVLTGFVAPTEWWAIGVLVSGTSFHLPDAADLVDPPLADRERIVVAYLVARDATSASACRRPDGEIWMHSAGGLDDAAIGRVDDVLRRTLGLPTHPPEHPTVELWARLWLDRVLRGVAARPRRRWSWSTIALLHPAAQLVLDDLSDRAADVADSMPRLAAMLGEGRTWTDLRLDHASAGSDSPAIPADVVEWMDDGIFSRWLLDALPTCADALLDLCDLLPDRLIARIEDALTAWGVSSGSAARLQPPPRGRHLR